MPIIFTKLLEGAYKSFKDHINSFRCNHNTSVVNSTIKQKREAEIDLNTDKEEHVVTLYAKAQATIVQEDEKGN